jgi:hypothetical protein
MKIYLASFFQPEYWGPGRKLALAFKKPDNIKVDGALCFLTPSIDLFNRYREFQKINPEKAKELFEDEYRKQLDDIFDEISREAEKENKSILDLLPLKEHDNLLSWEKKGNLSFRTILAVYLKKIGYEVILN